MCIFSSYVGLNSVTGCSFFFARQKNSSHSFVIFVLLNHICRHIKVLFAVRRETNSSRVAPPIPPNSAKFRSKWSQWFKFKHLFRTSCRSSCIKTDCARESSGVRQRLHSGRGGVIKEIQCIMSKHVFHSACKS